MKKDVLLGTKTKTDLSCLRHYSAEVWNKDNSSMNSRIQLNPVMP
ncbi:MAG: hypothetical protein ACKVOR_06620 [Flavobacteriales bacterium]